MALFPKFIYRVNKIFIKIPTNCFAEMDKPFLKSIQKFKGLKIAKTILKNNHVLGGLTLSCFKVIVNKTVWQGNIRNMVA